MNVFDMAKKDVPLKRASSTHGGEWWGPCPSCGGDDRFHVWPEKNEGKGAYWCRGCGKSGDNIQYLRDFRGMSYRDSCAELGISAKNRDDYISPNGSIDRPGRPSAPEFKPAVHENPADLWQKRAEKFISWSGEALKENGAVLAWLADRGIDEKAVKQYRLGWNQGENEKDIYRPRSSWGLPASLKEDGKPRALWIPRGLVIPYMIGNSIGRIRIRRPEGEPRYYVIPGSSMATMILEGDRRAFVVVESELDGIAVVGACNLTGACALGSASSKPDAAACEVLRGSLRILNALDYDQAGAKAMTWWTDNFGRCVRWPVPVGKDPGEVIRMGKDLKSWITEGLPPALTISVPPPVRYPTPDIRHGEPDLRNSAPPPGEYPAELLELYNLLRQNPSVRIIHTCDRFTVLRDGKYVGGRINFLVFRVPVVTDYVLNHPAEQIDGTNFLQGFSAVKN